MSLRTAAQYRTAVLVEALRLDEQDVMGTIYHTGVPEGGVSDDESAYGADESTEVGGIDAPPSSPQVWSYYCPLEHIAESCNNGYAEYHQQKARISLITAHAQSV